MRFVDAYLSAEILRSAKSSWSSKRSVWKNEKNRLIVAMYIGVYSTEFTFSFAK